MTVKKIIPYIIVLMAATIWASCDKGEGANPEPDPIPPCRANYASDIKTIVQAKCAISGCHDGNSAVVAFTTYAPLKERADNGRIKSYLFELKIMPPASATQLTEDEKKLMQCWLDNGAPEN